jgi:predicted RNase H-like HicB family nuclease
MKTIGAIIERANDGTFSVYCKDEMFTGMGDSVEAAKQNMIEQMQFFKETSAEDGHEYPDFLDEDYEIVYKFDTQSLLEYYAGIITLAALERLTGINRKQLWSYMHGNSKPRKQQVDKIQNALHNLGKELTAISL